MAITNHERVGKALDLLRLGLAPFVERELKTQYQQGWLGEIKGSLAPQQLSIGATEKDPMSDVAVVLAVLWNQWNEVFRRTLGHADRSIVSELRGRGGDGADARNVSVAPCPGPTEAPGCGGVGVSAPFGAGSGRRAGPRCTHRY